MTPAEIEAGRRRYAIALLCGDLLRARQLWPDQYVPLIHEFASAFAGIIERATVTKAFHRFWREVGRRDPARVIERGPHTAAPCLQWPVLPGRATVEPPTRIIAMLVHITGRIDPRAYAGRADAFIARAAWEVAHAPPQHTPHAPQPAEESDARLKRPGHARQAARQRGHPVRHAAHE